MGGLKERIRIRVLEEGVASELPQVISILGEEQSHCPEKANVRQTPHVRSQFLTLMN